MRTLRFNGEYWYEDRRPLLARIARWLVWFGGWEAHSKPDVLGQVRPLRERLRPEMLAPVSLFGHRVTYYGWGFQVKTPEGWLVVARRGHDERAIYISRDGTPGRAHIWLHGEPADVRSHARYAS